MSGKLLLGFVVAILMVGEVSAQSGARGSGSRGFSGGSGSSANNFARNQARLNQQRLEQQRRLEKQQAKAQKAQRVATETNRILAEIQRENLAGVPLDSEQEKVLGDLVSSNYNTISKNQRKMQSLIPKRQASALQKSYLAFVGKGNSRTEATMMSMKSVGLSDSLQTKVMKYNDKNEAIKQKITTKVTEMFDEEQKQIMMAKKEEMMAKEKLMAKEKAGSSKRSDF